MDECKCLACDKIFKGYKTSGGKVRKYCSKPCYAKREITPEWLEKISKARLGKEPWNKGTAKPKEKKEKVTREKRQFQCAVCDCQFHRRGYTKNYTPKFCSRECLAESFRKKRYCLVCEKHLAWNKKIVCSKGCLSVHKKGVPLSEFHKETLRGPRLHMRGEKAYNYTGYSTKRQTDMGRHEYREWRRKVFVRDNFTCQHCSKKGAYLNADHIKPYAFYPHLRYEVDNGRTLCLECHKKTETFGCKAKKLKVIA